MCREGRERCGWGDGWIDERGEETKSAGIQSEGRNKDGGVDG